MNAESESLEYYSLYKGENNLVKNNLSQSKRLEDFEESKESVSRII